MRGTIVSIFSLCIFLLFSCKKEDSEEPNGNSIGELVLTSQKDIENLSQGYTVVTGKLQIGAEEGSSDVSDLSPLGSIIEVGSLDIIGNESLEDLNGLGVKQVNHDLKISKNSKLKSIEGLVSLASVGEGFTIDDNDALEGLSGLENLISVGGDVKITNNNELKSDDDYCALSLLLEADGVTGSVVISGNGHNPTSSEILTACLKYFWVSDENFRSELKTTVSNAFTPNDSLIISHPDVLAVETIDVSGKSISSLSGVEYFTGLTELNCSNNSLTSLDISSNSGLTELHCHGNGLTSLDISSTSLSVLSVDAAIKCEPSIIEKNPTDSKYWDGSELASYTPSTDCYYFWVPDDNFRSELKTTIVPNAFTPNDSLITNHPDVLAVDSINVYGKSISSLSGVEYFTSLTTLACAANQLTELDVSKLTALTELNCSFNYPLATLNVSGCVALETLLTDMCAITSLDVSALTSLTWLHCGENDYLTNLNVSGLTSLGTLVCSGTAITELDLSGLTNLESLYCSGNSNLTSLDISGSTSLHTLQVDEAIKCEPSIKDVNPADSKYWDGDFHHDYDPATDCP